MSRNRGAALASLLLLTACVAATRAQNLDTLQPIVRSTPGQARGYFGYSAVLHQTSTATNSFGAALANTR